MRPCGGPFSTSPRPSPNAARSIDAVQSRKGCRRRHLVRGRSAARPGGRAERGRDEAGPRPRIFPESDAFAGAPHPRHAGGLGRPRRGGGGDAGGLSRRPTRPCLADRRPRRASARRRSPGASPASCSPIPIRTPVAVREARDLRVDAEHPPRASSPRSAHPDFALVRREWKRTTKRLCTEIRVDDVRDALQVFQMSAAFGGWRVCIVDCAEDLNRSSANALLKMIEEPPPRSLILDRVASAGAGAADDPLALPPPQARSAVAARNRRSRRRPRARRGATPIRRRSPSAAGRANGSVREALRAARAGLRRGSAR